MIDFLSRPDVLEETKEVARDFRINGAIAHRKTTVPTVPAHVVEPPAPAKPLKPGYITEPPTPVIEPVKPGYITVPPTPVIEPPAKPAKPGYITEPPTPVEAKSNGRELLEGIRSSLNTIQNLCGVLVESSDTAHLTMENTLTRIARVEASVTDLGSKIDKLADAIGGLSHPAPLPPMVLKRVGRPSLREAFDGLLTKLAS